MTPERLREIKKALAQDEIFIKRGDSPEAFNAEMRLYLAMCRELLAYIAELEATVQQLRAEHRGWDCRSLRQYVDDTSEGFQCLPGCDSHAHDDLCPVTNTVQAFRLLRSEVERLTRELAEVRSVLKRILL